MRCPQCRQEVQELRGEACPYCGFPCAEFDRRVRVIQVILFALFMSTLLYGVLVAILEMVVRYRPAGLGEVEHVVGGAMLGAAAGVFLASLAFERRALEAATLDSYAHTVIILAAIAELPAVFGLVMYLLAGSLPWMVVFLAASWVLFLRLGTRLPLVLRGITDCLRT